MKTILFLQIFLTLSSSLSAQTSLKMFVEGDAKQETGEIIAKSVRDDNGEVCAGLIVYSDLKGLSFQANNGIVKRTSDPGKDFLFLSADERLVEVYCDGYTPLKIILNEHGIRLKSGQTWSLKVTGDKKLDVVPVNFIITPKEAIIIVDGVNKGNNATQQLAAGKHEVRIEKEGFKSLTQSITVSTTQNLFTFTLQEVEQRPVTISSTPDGAQILIDNSERGETPKGVYLYPAKYSLRLIKSGFVDVQGEIEVKENASNKFTYTLSKNAGTLVLRVTPSDARIFINKEDYTGKTTIDLAPGRHKIEIEKSGYNSAGETIEIELGKRIERNFSLTARTGGLQFSVTPFDAKVLLQQNGTTVQQWEGLKIVKGLPVGEYELQVSAGGYAMQKKRIEIIENRTIAEDVILKKNVPTSLSVGGFKFVSVVGGTFHMGSNESDDEKPIHIVTVNSFFIGKYEVTQKQWQSVMGNNPSKFKGDNLPVERVSWNDIQGFITKLNQRENTSAYRLPTEAEWEYAARGGKFEVDRNLKGDGQLQYSGSNNIDNVAWYTSNSGNTTHAVGTKQANELGIYDMTGNVWEWCNDRYDANYYKETSEIFS